MKSASKHSSGAASRWLLGQARRARTFICLAVGLGFASGLLLVGQAALLARIVDGAFMQGMSSRDLWPLFVALGGAVLMRAALGWAREVAGFHAGSRVREAVRMALMAHISALGPMHASRGSSGALATAVMENVEGLHDFFAHYLPQLALAAMIPAAIICFVFPLSWAAGGLLLVTAPLIPLFMILVGMGAESISQRHFQALARMSAHFLDVLQGLPTLKLFGRSRDEAENVARVSRDYRRRTMGVLRVAFLSSAVLEFFSSFSIALVAVYLGLGYLGYLSFGAYGRPLTLESGLFILLLAPDFYLPLRELGTHYHARAEAMGAAEGLLEIFAESPQLVERDRAAATVGSQPPAIRFENVSLAYEGGRRPALEEVSFQLRPGEQIVVAGPSGAGKTTILNLLLGFCLPDKGRIFIDQTPLDSFDLSQWRRCLAWIGQQPTLFHGTLEENIRMGRPDAADAEVAKAARAARVTDFAENLPKGLETRVGEQGLGLSRGQAQRVALARAFLKDAPVLLLDEPTASLDPQNEHLVMNAVNTLSKGRSVILLSHRLAHVSQADRVIAMAGGRIVEQGRYSDLMASGGAFSRLAASPAQRGLS